MMAAAADVAPATARARRSLLVAGLCACVLLAVLVSLGLWQLRRLAWKEGILAEIARAEAAAPVPLPAVPLPFQKVSVRGHARPDLVALYGAELHDTPAGPVPGAHRIVPLERAGALPVLVDLGWVPDHPASPVAPPEGEAEVVGYARPPERAGWFAAADDVAGRRFYTLDPAAIGTGLGLGPVAPFTLVALAAEPAPGAAEPIPAPATHLPRPPNDHLQYALTWFALAATLVVMFALYARKALRR